MSKREILAERAGPGHPRLPGDTSAAVRHHSLRMLRK